MMGTGKGKGKGKWVRNKNIIHTNLKDGNIGMANTYTVLSIPLAASEELYAGDLHDNIGLVLASLPSGAMSLHQVTVMTHAYPVKLK